MIKKDNRLKREHDTIKVMVKMYCSSMHSSSDALCTECKDLFDYAFLKIDCCCFGPEKPACSECWIHCYEKEKRERIKVVMRYAGPRMLYKHPYLGIMHFVDKYRFNAKKKKLKNST